MDCSAKNSQIKKLTIGQNMRLQPRGKEVFSICPLVVDQIVNGAPVVRPCKSFMAVLFAGWNGHLDHQEVFVATM